MKLQFPWARRKHYHRDETLFKFICCSGCGHLILFGRVDNKKVEVIDRSQGISHCEIYGKSCAPNYDMKEIGLDGEIRYYEKGVRIKEVK